MCTVFDLHLDKPQAASQNVSPLRTETESIEVETPRYQVIDAVRLGLREWWR